MQICFGFGVPSPSSGASSSLALAPEPSISSSSAGYEALASFCMALPLRRAFRSFSLVKTGTHILKQKTKHNPSNAEKNDSQSHKANMKLNDFKTYWFHFMLLQNLIQFLPLLVVEVEVLALWHGFWSHHLCDSRPIPTILKKTLNWQTSKRIIVGQTKANVNLHGIKSLPGVIQKIFQHFQGLMLKEILIVLSLIEK